MSDWWLLTCCYSDRGTSKAKVEKFLGSKSYPWYGWEDEYVFAIPAADKEMVMEEVRDMEISYSLDRGIKVVPGTDMNKVLVLDFDHEEGEFCLRN